MTRRKIDDARFYVRPEELRFEKPNATLLKHKGAKTFTLPECVTCLVPQSDPEYLELDAMIEQGFIVLDIVTGTKAVCCHPSANVDNLELMIASYFDAPARRIADRVWMC